MVQATCLECGGLPALHSLDEGGTPLFSSAQADAQLCVAASQAGQRQNHIRLRFLEPGLVDRRP